MDMKQLSNDIDELATSKTIAIIGWVALFVVGLVGFKIGSRHQRIRNAK